MVCPHCTSQETTRRAGTTSLGYVRFVCHTCGRRFNERSGTPFNDLHYPTDIVLNAVLWRLRYKLSFRDVAELLLIRGFAVTHETIRQWEARFAPLLAERLREKRRGRRSVSWYLDAERAPRPCCRSPLPSPAARPQREAPASHHHRPSPGIREGDSLDRRQC